MADDEAAAEATPATDISLIIRKEETHTHTCKQTHTEAHTQTHRQADTHTRNIQENFVRGREIHLRGQAQRARARRDRQDKVREERRAGRVERGGGVDTG